MLQIRFEEQDLSIKSILDEKADRLKSLKQISKKAELTEYKIARVDDWKITPCEVITIHLVNWARPVAAKPGLQPLQHMCLVSMKLIFSTQALENRNKRNAKEKIRKLEDKEIQ